MNISGKHGMEREYEEMDINSSDVQTEKEHSDTKRHQPPQNTVRIRSSRSAVVCLVLLCVLLLTAVIMLCVHIQTNNTNYTQETHQLLTKITNLTEEKDKLLTKINNLKDKRDELLIKNTNLSEQRDQLLTRNSNLTEQRDELLTKITALQTEKDHLTSQKQNLINDRDGLLSKNVNLTKQSKKLHQEKTELWKSLIDGWIYYQSSFYFISSEKKSWTESRRYCTERGADLIIINNREEQEFAKTMSHSNAFWIGLTDIDVEGTWKWVDGSTLTSGFRFWGSREPNGHGGENCVASYPSGWCDYPCNDAFRWICKKSLVKYQIS